VFEESPQEYGSSFVVGVVDVDLVVIVSLITGALAVGSILYMVKFQVIPSERVIQGSSGSVRQVKERSMYSQRGK
jgi:hypothetical protein